MTSLTSSAPVTSAARPGAATNLQARAKAKRQIVPLVGGGVLLAVVTGAIWVATSLGGGSGPGGGVDSFLVAPQSFKVLLKEKGELKAAKSTDVKCEVEGKSTIISLIDEGTPVKEGDLLVELASNEIDDRIQKEELSESNAVTAYEAAKAELDIQRDQNASNIRKGILQIELKQLELDKYEKGDWSQKVKDAEIAIEQATITLQRRTQDFNASSELLEKKYITQTEFDEDEFNFKKAQWEVDKTKKALEVLEQYTHVAELRQKASDLEEATKELDRIKKNADAEETKKLRAVEGKEKELALTRDQLTRLRTQKEKSKIYAPTQGFVVYYAEGGGRWMMSNEGQIKEGATVHEQQILMQLPDTTTMTASIRVHEAKTDKLRLGQSVGVTVEGLPGKQFTGKVTKIAALADSQSGWLNPDLKEYETEITLDPTDEVLKPGVTAHVEILVEDVDEKLAVPVQAIYTKGPQRYVFKDSLAGAKYTPIELGAIGTEWAEVRSGLEPGEKIRLAFNDEDKRAIPDPTGDGKGGPPRVGGPRPQGAGMGGGAPPSGGGSRGGPRGGNTGGRKP